MSIMDMLYNRPKVLQDQVLSAFRGVSNLSQEEFLQYLAIYRRNKSRNIVLYAAKYGLTNLKSSSGIPQPKILNELIPIEHIEDIRRLDEAFQALHKFNKPDGHLDYLSKSTFIEIQRILGESRRGTKSKLIIESHAEVVEHLTSRNYGSSDNKTALILAAAEKFEFSERTIRDIASRANLTRKYSKS